MYALLTIPTAGFAAAAVSKIVFPSRVETINILAARDISCISLTLTTFECCLLNEHKKKVVSIKTVLVSDGLQLLI